MAAAITHGVTTIAYGAQQVGMLVPAAIAQRVVRFVGGARAPQPDRATIKALNRRVRELLERDLANVERGMYPRRLLFSIPVSTYARRLPRLFADFPRSMWRRRQADYRDLPDEVDARDYPAYFRRTFHWQTDGYLSRRSAELYDVGVEFLFAGTADVMRRQVIPPITTFLRAAGGAKGKRLLDVACGTGRTLAQIAQAHPGAQALRAGSVALLRAAGARAPRGRAGRVPRQRERGAHALRRRALRRGHERVPVPRAAEERAAPRHRRDVPRARARRAPRHRGLGAVRRVLGHPLLPRALPEDFHEPFYRDYLKDDLRAALEESGFEVASVDPCFVAKVVVARKPEC
ncbi:MAG: hypothetical protein M5U28_01010 [Sandaracinaceae bacterium]|nr:hypothetical protein [Sandaracinaceae bacterium]